MSGTRLATGGSWSGFLQFALGKRGENRKSLLQQVTAHTKATHWETIRANIYSVTPLPGRILCQLPTQLAGDVRDGRQERPVPMSTAQWS